MQQIMAHHREKVFHMMSQTTSKRNDILTWDMFITHQDVQNLSSKKVVETYRLHQNNALSMRMWLETNKDSVFHYTKTCKVGLGALHASNVPFTIGIQSPWQKEMMLQFDHRSGIAIDATFGTSAKKVLNTTSACVPGCLRKIHSVSPLCARCQSLDNLNFV